MLFMFEGSRAFFEHFKFVIAVDLNKGLEQIKYTIYFTRDYK